MYPDTFVTGSTIEKHLQHNYLIMVETADLTKGYVSDSICRNAKLSTYVAMYIYSAAWIET